MRTGVDLAACERAAGIDLKQFGSDPWRLRVLEYKRLIWTLACAFSNRHCECTHCEIAERPTRSAPRTIALCLSFTNRQTFAGFRTFLQRNLDVIPETLRAAFIMNIGWNDGNAGGVIIAGDRVRRCTQTDVDAVGGNSIWNVLRVDHETLRAMRRLDTELWSAAIGSMARRPPGHRRHR